jgi:hypothetical protein
MKMHLTVISLTSLVALLLVGCVGITPSTKDASDKPIGVITASPIPEPTSTVPPSAKVGFADTSSGAPKVTRPGEKAKALREGATTVTFSTAASYPDGISITTAKFARGTVSSRGTGVITGAPYLVLKLTLANGSHSTIDVSEVVVTLKYGPKSDAAAPLYDDVAASDFSGSLPAGQSQTATYAFQLPKEINSADLYVDINGSLLPAHFAGTLPHE